MSVILNIHIMYIHRQSLIFAYFTGFRSMYILHIYTYNLYICILRFNHEAGIFKYVTLEASLRQMYRLWVYNNKYLNLRNKKLCDIIKIINIYLMFERKIKVLAVFSGFTKFFRLWKYLKCTRKFKFRACRFSV